MVVRNCSGGIVFYEDTVLMLLNDKQEWCFPKGVVTGTNKLMDVAIERIKVEAGVEASIIAPCGKSHYEFFSASRQKPVHNNVSWFVMKANSNEVVPNKEQGFVDGKFFPVEEALKTITYTQDRSLLMVAYQRYKEIV